MVASLSFKQIDRQTAATGLADIHTIIYEDNTGNKYTFGVDSSNVFNTFKYDPDGADEVDYSTIATTFMTGGAIATLLGIGTNVGEIKAKTDNIPANLTAKVTAIETATNAANLGNKVTAIQTKTDKITDTLGADVTAIKAKTEFIPDTFTADVAAIKDATSAANLGNKVTAIQTKTDKITDTLGADVTAIKAKTDKMPDDLQEELDALPGFEYIDTLVVSLAKTADVTAIKAKTDKMPADLDAELGKLAKSAELTPLAKTAELAPLVTPLAKSAELAPLAKSAELAPLVTPLAKSAELAPLVAPLAKSAELAPLVAPLAKTFDVTAIKAKTDTIPADLIAKVTAIETATNAANLGTKLDGIKTKTDKMPANLNAELIKLTAIAETLNGSPQAAAAAKAVLESSFKKAIEEAGEDGSEWLKNEIKEIVSQPSFEIPQDSSEALSWDW